VIAVAVTITAAATALALGAPAPHSAAGAPVATLEIPAIGVRTLVREGVSAPVLGRGPGHYPGTSLPNDGGTIGIAGHRVTHSRPFLNLNELRRGDLVLLWRHSRRYVYRVTTMRIVAPTAVWTLRPAPVETLALTACHPPRTDVQRLVVFAERADA
jgi:sortase A